ncbi:MAG: alpha/beta fold hydrolase [Alphaproteobacteria bacterium]|nr:alpha/beta fold hydrolase [Alphaproteobacteria bacterium]MCW5744490.1 alpha/beta fold hydrolase [Alphaproteobacteria bacterium]
MAKEPLILVPGVLCDEDLYRDQVPALAAYADVNIAMEQARHDTLPAIARAILDAAPRRFALCGLSMGGIIAFEIMRQQPARVSRLALLDTNARNILADERRVREGRMRLVANGHVDVMIGLQLSRFIPLTRLADEALVDRVLKMIRRVGAATYLRQERALLQRVDSRPSLAAITCPTLVLCGREDSATPLAMSQEIAAAIPGAVLEIVEECGHLSTMEQPASVNAALLRWLDM